MTLSSQIDTLPPWTRMQLRVLTLALLFYVITNMTIQIVPIVVPALISDWSLPAADFDVALAAGFVGMALGASAGGLLGDRYGRKVVMVGCALLFGLGTAAIALATQPAHLVVLRFLTGLLLAGGIPNALALMTESVQPKRQGIVMSVAMLFPPLGIALAGIAGAAIIPQLGWKAMLGITGLLSLILALLITLFLPESPAYLARFVKHRARLETLVSKLGIATPEIAAAQEQKSSAFLPMLRDPSLRLTTMGILGAFLFAFAALSIILSWLPTLLSGVGLPLDIAGAALSVWSVSGMAGALAAGWAISRWGVHRVTSIIILASAISAGALGFSAAVFAPFSGTILVLLASLLAIMGFLVNGVMASIYTYATQAFPENVRASGLGFSLMAGNIGAIIGALIGGRLIALGAIGFFSAEVALLLLVLFSVSLRLFEKQQSKNKLEPAA